MRRAARVDANHSEIVQALRAVGASVVSLASVGQGVPDLLVGFRGRNYLLEVKDGSKPPSRQRLRPGQREFALTWSGQVATVHNPEQALEVIGAHIAK